MKIIKVTNKEGDVSGTYMFWCPGCEGYHSIKVPGWTFNGDMEKPTISPSILVNGNIHLHNPNAKRCHSFVKDGKIQFLGDCDHDLKNQTVELPDAEPV